MTLQPAEEKKMWTPVISLTDREKPPALSFKEKEEEEKKVNENSFTFRNCKSKKNEKLFKERRERRIVF